MSSATDQIARAFVEARQSGNPLGEYPGTPPRDLASAYAIQDRALTIWKRPVGGWKVGKISPPRSEELAANRLAGPVFADTVRHESDGIDFPIFAGGFAAVEAEFMLRLAIGDAPLPTTPAEAVSWVDEVRIGLEIASSPYARINADGPCVTVSDHGNNAGILLGRTVPREHWERLDEIEVTLSIDNAEVGRATTATMLDGPFGAVCFLLENFAQRGITPVSGWWVSSGAITGVHEIKPGQNSSATFKDIGQIAASIKSTKMFDARLNPSVVRPR